MIVLCSAAILASGCATSHSHATAWEYEIIERADTVQLQREINTAASDGWIVVSAGGSSSVFAVLKRAKK